MRKRNAPFVISIAGVSGAGKTTITKELNKKLRRSKRVHFDDYDFNGPSDVINWVNRGANYDEWDLAPLTKDLETLFFEPLDFIVMDYPFAYKHTKISKMIDVTIFIDTPLDIAMARRFIRDYKNSSSKNILFEMENYITRGRRGYIEMIRSIKTNSDIIIDGTLPIDKITDKLYQEILEQKQMKY